MLGLTARRWITRLGISALVIAVLYSIIALTPWSIDLCGEDEIAEAYSPDGRHLARAFVRNCGATTGYLTHVNLRSEWSYFNPTWFGAISQGEVFANACLSDISLDWRDASHLQITYQSCTRAGQAQVQIKEGSWNNIEILYEDSSAAGTAK